jgi:hypothetical protein
MLYALLLLGAIEAPENAVVGELVRLKETATEVVWQVEPATPDFEAVGNRAFFSARAKGDYLVIAASVKDGKPSLSTHHIHIGDVSLDTVIKELLKRVVSQNGREEALALAKSFRAIGGQPNNEILGATVKANNEILKGSLEVWKPFLDGVAKYLDDNSITNYQSTWITIADAIERHVK